MRGQSIALQASDFWDVRKMNKSHGKRNYDRKQEVFDHNRNDITHWSFGWIRAIDEKKQLGRLCMETLKGSC